MQLLTIMVQEVERHQRVSMKAFQPQLHEASDRQSIREVLAGGGIKFFWLFELTIYNIAFLIGIFIDVLINALICRLSIYLSNHRPSSSQLL